MRLWIDVQLPPQSAEWIEEHFSLKATALRSIGLRDANDKGIFDRATSKCRNIRRIVCFVELVHRLGASPKVL
ncbi:MAG: DUF5615 family PIN-like protein [Pyrinomonadaceae bacterium]